MQLQNTFNTVFMIIGMGLAVIFVIVRRIRKKMEKRARKQKMQRLRLDLIAAIQKSTDTPKKKAT